VLWCLDGAPVALYVCLGTVSADRKGVGVHRITQDGFDRGRDAHPARRFLASKPNQGVQDPFNTIRHCSEQYTDSYLRLDHQAEAAWESMTGIR
jgi:hypothetical protein